MCKKIHNGGVEEPRSTGSVWQYSVILQKMLNLWQYLMICVLDAHLRLPSLL